MQTFSVDKYPSVLVMKSPYTEKPEINMVKGKEPVETATDFYKRAKVKPKWLSNLGLYSTKTGVATLTLVIDGKLEAYDPTLLLGFAIDKKGNLSCAHYNDGSWVHFISGYPCLIVDSKKVPITCAYEINYNARRTVYAYGTKAIYSFLIEGNGMMFQAIQDMLLDTKAFTCADPEFNITHAINCDGGGSTIGILDGIQRTNLMYNRAVDSFMTITPTANIPEPTQKYWRVQCSACPTEQEAIQIRNYIRKLPDPIRAGYKTAEVFFEYPWHKVQVGMYSTWNYAGAVRVREDLRKNKIDSFITYR